MAENKRAPASTKLVWASERKRKASALMHRTVSIANNLFSSNDITPFLNLVSRLHYFDARNLLLIYERFPEATCLGGYKIWERMIQPPGAQVLKKEWIGKGIDLLAPFTESLDGKYLLVWFSVTMYDVGQTNAVYTPPSSAYINDSEHRHILFECFQKVLANSFGHSVVLISPTASMRATGLPGSIADGPASVIRLRMDISEEDQLRWLGEILIRMVLYRFNAPSEHEEFLVRCINHCLSRIWSLPEWSQRPVRPISDLSDDMRIQLLFLVQQAVRTLDDIISREYLQYRKDEDLLSPTDV